MSDFYERNRIERPMQNAKSPSECLDSTSRETILRNTFLQMQSMRALRGLQLCVWIGRVTTHGSGYSNQICEEMGWDPEMKITPSAVLPRNARTSTTTHE